MRRVFNLPQLKDQRRQLRHDLSPAEHILWRYLRGRQLLGLKFRHHPLTPPHLRRGPVGASLICESVRKTLYCIFNAESWPLAVPVNK
ncbi:MAG: DUF559 domain-containing protein [Patescibacteria group bacterium]